MSEAPGQSETPSFGNRLRVLRETASLTQEELAERAGVTVDAVSALERGTRRRPYPHTVRSLAAALGLTETQRAALQSLIPRRTPASPKQGFEAELLTPGEASLPSATTPLVGRERELDEIDRLLVAQATRLVTLTGPGGVGKTRLGLEIAHRVSFPDGVVFVPLAPLSDASQVVPAISHVLRVRDLPGVSATESLVAHLRPKKLLLVLDNAEHVLDAAPIVADLLSGCGWLVVLVTSRAPLRLRGELEYAVPALASADAGDLFVQRALAAAPGFTVDDSASQDVREICRRLAGLPLALEIAAAKVRTISLATLLTRLDEALESGGSRDLPERQRSVRAALDWSHRLLDDDEQRAFRWLSVFAAGFTLDSAEALVGKDALRHLERLADNSLVTVSREGNGGVRYGMLEPIRQYARGRLVAAAEETTALAAHARVILDLAERAGPAFMTGDQAQWLLLIDREDDDIRSVMAWAVSTGEAEIAARIGWALWLPWWLRGTWREGREWLEASVKGELPAAVRNRVLSAAGALAYAEGDLPAAARHWETAVAGAEAAADPEALAHAVAGTALIAMASEAEQDAAADRLTRAIELADMVGQDWLWSLSHVWLGTVRLAQGRQGEAVPLFEQGLASARARGDRLVTYVALFNLAKLAGDEGDIAVARIHIQESVELSRETGDRANLAYCLDALASLEVTSGGHERAAVLLGAADGLRGVLGAPSYGYYLASDEDRARTIAAVRDGLGDESYGRAVARGSSMGIEDMLALAVGPL